MTTEIFRNTIFEDPKRLDAFDFVVFDEVHYLDDLERGTVWEESILYAPPHVRIVALSATVPNVQELADWIAQVRERPVTVVVETERPVPLVHKVWVPGRGPRGLDELRAISLEAARRRRGRRVAGAGRGPEDPRARGRHPSPLASAPSCRRSTSSSAVATAKRWRGGTRGWIS